MQACVYIPFDLKLNNIPLSYWYDVWSSYSVLIMISMFQPGDINNVNSKLTHAVKTVSKILLGLLIRVL